MMHYYPLSFYSIAHISYMTCPCGLCRFLLFNSSYAEVVIHIHPPKALPPLLTIPTNQRDIPYTLLYHITSSHILLDRQAAK
jgi:hypothetical protein